MIRAAVRQCVISLRLYFRNPLAMSYGYIFPVVFLLAFWGLYRYDRVPLVRHMGELLTISVLGGACFGLPTTLVSEREKGVWRRYRLMPVSVGVLAASTIAARYVLLVSAGLLQVALALVIGMPLPAHAFQLWVAFTIVTFAFLGCGLVIAAIADTVPAVQALGQILFLPMLIIGGVAVPLASLPGWAQHASRFLPGRYAVEVLQACVAGDGLPAATLDAIALLVIGSAACVAGAMMFRWDQHERFASRGDRGWVAAALAAWIAVGAFAEWRVVRNTARVTARGSSTAAVTAPSVDSSSVALPELKPSAAETAANKQAAAAAPISPPAPRPHPASWQAVSERDITADLTFDRLPPDDGIITPIALPNQQPDAATAAILQTLASGLDMWAPAAASDPVQRARNLLYVAAVADLLQIDVERYAPRVIFERLQRDTDRLTLERILYWIALHPFDGDDAAVADVPMLGLAEPAATAEDVRGRAAVYGVKLLGRLLGRL